MYQVALYRGTLCSGCIAFFKRMRSTAISAHSSKWAENVLHLNATGMAQECERVNEVWDQFLYELVSLMFLMFSLQDPKAPLHRKLDKADMAALLSSEYLRNITLPEDQQFFSQFSFISETLKMEKSPPDQSGTMDGKISPASLSSSLERISLASLSSSSDSSEYFSAKEDDSWTSMSSGSLSSDQIHDMMQSSTQTDQNGCLDNQASNNFKRSFEDPVTFRSWEGILSLRQSWLFKVFGLDHLQL